MLASDFQWTTLLWFAEIMLHFVYLYKVLFLRRNCKIFFLSYEETLNVYFIIHIRTMCRLLRPCNLNVLFEVQIFFDVRRNIVLIKVSTQLIDKKKCWLSWKYTWMSNLHVRSCIFCFQGKGFWNLKAHKDLKQNIYFAWPKDKKPATLLQLYWISILI